MNTLNGVQSKVRKADRLFGNELDVEDIKRPVKIFKN